MQARFVALGARPRRGRTFGAAGAMFRRAVPGGVEIDVMRPGSASRAARSSRARQHGVVTPSQLRRRGMSAARSQHRVKRGWLRRCTAASTSSGGSRTRAVRPRGSTDGRSVRSGPVARSGRRPRLRARRVLILVLVDEHGGRRACAAAIGCSMSREALAGGHEANAETAGARPTRPHRGTEADMRPSMHAHGHRRQGPRGSRRSLRRADRRPRRPAPLHGLRASRSSRSTRRDDLPDDLDERLGEPGEFPFTRGVAPRDVPQAAVDDAPVRGLRVGEGVQRALQVPARARLDRPVAWPSTCRRSSAWTPTTRAASARSGAPASRSTRSTTCGPRSTGSRSTRSRPR